VTRRGRGEINHEQRDGDGDGDGDELEMKLSREDAQIASAFSICCFLCCYRLGSKQASIGPGKVALSICILVSVLSLLSRLPRLVCLFICLSHMSCLGRLVIVIVIIKMNTPLQHAL
jgi:hypothetical protein